MTLSMTGVGLHLNGVALLDGIDFRVRAGEILAILGPNGAGKSTLLKVLSGEWQPTVGSVRFNGRPISQWPVKARARTLGILPQGTSLDFPFTVEEVVMLGRTPHDSGLKRDVAIVAEALAAVDGSHLRKRFYTQLSGGEKQRVQLARVLAQIWEDVPGSASDEGLTRFLILDEPTASFDLAHQQLTLDLVSQLASRGYGVVMVVHDLNMAARSATEILLLNCGRMVAHGQPAEVLTPATIRQVFAVDALVQPHPLTGKPLVIT